MRPSIFIGVKAMAYFRISFWMVIVSSVAFVLSISSMAQAEPYLRVCQKGVIYYYFDSHAEKAAKPLVKTGRKLMTNHQVQRKLSIQDLEPVIQEASNSHKVPPSLVKAVIRVESNFNPNATSPKGAQGLMQLMPETAEDLQVANPYDQRENVLGGVKYLRMLLERYDNCLPLALAAYNAGPKRVDQRQQVPAIPETQWFVRDVCNKFIEYSRATPAH